jgi:hypothetical protein
MGRSAEHLLQSAFFGRVLDLVYANLALLDSQIIGILDLRLHVNDRLTGNAIHNARILRRRNQLKPAKSGLLQHKDVEHSALFDVVVQQPEYVVKPVILSVLYCRHQRPHIARNSESPVA